MFLFTNEWQVETLLLNGPIALTKSTLVGDSTFRISAPMSPIIIVAKGPGIYVVKSSIFKFAKAPIVLIHKLLNAT